MEKTDIRRRFCPKCQLMVTGEHKHIPSKYEEGIWTLVKEKGSCGCNHWHLKKQCIECGKLLCGKNGEHCIRLTKNNIEAANGTNILCVDCGLKIRNGNEN